MKRSISTWTVVVPSREAVERRPTSAADAARGRAALHWIAAQDDMDNPRMLMVPMINRGGAPREDDLSGANERMIRDQMIARGIRDERVLGAFRSVPRELFVPHALLSAAFDDSPLPLDRGQTISQPFIVALMTQTLRLQPGHSVLEIGTGSGYQTAVLARLARKVYSAELEPDLARDVQARLDQLAITNVILGVGDGLRIFRDNGPFDAILSAAAPVRLPEELLGQLTDGGRMVIPIGSPDLQYLWLFERRGEEILRRQLDAVRFVPLRT